MPISMWTSRRKREQQPQPSQRQQQVFGLADIAESGAAITDDLLPQQPLLRKHTVANCVAESGSRCRNERAITTVSVITTGAAAGSNAGERIGTVLTTEPMS